MPQLFLKLSKVSETVFLRALFLKWNFTQKNLESDEINSYKTFFIQGELFYLETSEYQKKYTLSAMRSFSVRGS